MRVIVLSALAIALSSAPVNSHGYGQVCAPDGPPERPVGSEDNNPGAGIGLNDDYSGRDVGRGISEAARIREAEMGRRSYATSCAMRSGMTVPRARSSSFPPCGGLS